MGRVRRTLQLVGLGSTAALAAAAGGATWYYASRITEPPESLPPVAPASEDRVRVERISDGEILLDGPDAARAGTWGLLQPGGYAQVSEVLDDGEAGVRRRVRVLSGEISTGQPATLDPYAYPHDPAVLGLPWDEVTVTTELGPAPAWRFDPAENPDDTWAVFVHGRSARRHECFRLLPTFASHGCTGLAISYRNDGDGPPSPDGHSHLGATEWADVVAAVEYARTAGARRIVLVGYSMGGACVVNALRLAGEELGDVAGLVLEGPVLDWGPVIRRAAVARGLPQAVLPLLLPSSMALAGLRAGIDWQRMRHLDDPSLFQHPKLLIHGVEDATVPVELADALADARPDIVTYVRVEGAGHVRSWNVAPTRVESAVRDFLDQIL